MPPPTVGAYQLLTLLGQGGMGVVYRATHLRLGRVVALKLIHRYRLTNPQAVKRFRREIRAASQLSHPNVVIAYDADEADGLHYYTMEYVDGPSLDRLVAREGPLSVESAVRLLRQAAAALAHAHECGLIHRDVKPANLLLTGDRATIKLADFGLVRQEVTDPGESSSLTGEGSVIGTPDFIAPEQAFDSRQVDIRADLYSLGGAFYFALAGHPPFPGGTAMEKIYRHWNTAPTPLTQFRSDLPTELVDILSRLLAKQPGERYQTPRELIAALNSLNAVPIDPLTTLESSFAPVRRSPPNRSLGPGVIVAVAATIVLAGIAATVAYLGKGGETTPPAAAEPPPTPARAAWVELSNRLHQLSDDPAAALQALAEFRRTYPATPEADRAAVAIARVGSAFDALPSPKRPFSGLTTACVAVYGDDRWRATGPLGQPAISPDGRWIAAPEGTRIRVWDVATGQTQAVFTGHSVRPLSLSFSPKGDRLLTAAFDGPKGQDRTARVWDLATGQEVHVFPEVNGAWAVAGAFAVDGATIWLGGYKEVRGYDARTYRHRSTWGENWSGWVGGVSFSPDGMTALVSMLSQLPVVRLIDVASGRERSTFRWDTSVSGGVAFLRGGSRAVTGHANGTIDVWDLDRGERTRTLKVVGGLRALATSPKSDQAVVVRANQSSGLFDLATGSDMVPLSSHPAEAATYSTDGTMVFTTATDGVIRRWDAVTGAPVSASVQGPTTFAGVVASPIGDTVAAWPPLTVWDTASGTQRVTDPDPSDPCRFAGFVADGEHVIAVKQSGRTLVLGARTGKALADFAPGVGPVTVAALRPDERAIAVGASDGTVQVIDLTDKSVIAQVDGPSQPVRAVGFVGSVVVAGWEDGTVRWSGGGKGVRLTEPVTAITRMGSGRHVYLTTKGGRVSSLDLDSDRVTERTEPLFVGSQYLSASPDGNWLASVRPNGTIAVGGPPYFRVSGEFPVVGAASALAITPESRHLLVIVGNGPIACLRREGVRR